MTEFSLVTNTPEFFNDICEEIRPFLNADKILLFAPDEKIPKTGFCVWHQVSEAQTNAVSSAVLFIEGVEKGRCDYPFMMDIVQPIEIKRIRKSAVKINIYRLMMRYTKKKMPWGPLTGIRPTKHLRDMEARIGEKRARDHFFKTLQVFKGKYKLAKDIVTRQQSVIDSISKNAVDIYIGIPFCPTVCAYCSFGTNRLKKGDAVQTRYMDTLIHEIEALKPAISRKDIRSVYIGGGTPTSLDKDVLERLLAAVKDWTKGREFTVEAGRPDTIDVPMLKLLKRYGVNRISINPQSFKSETLKNIGRSHSVEAVYDAFQLAREQGFSFINVDLILGLPGESLWDMRVSLKKAIAMSPENITVHTLAIKNASALSRTVKYTANEAMMESAVSMAERLCRKNGYQPYYMYRQKYMEGNLENVGYAKPDRHSVYNIDMMEEVTSVVAFGAGAVSKKIYPNEGRHERMANPKDLKTYMDKIDIIIQKKKSAFD